MAHLKSTVTHDGHLSLEIIGQVCRKKMSRWREGRSHGKYLDRGWQENLDQRKEPDTVGVRYPKDDILARA